MIKGTIVEETAVITANHHSSSTLKFILKARTCWKYIIMVGTPYTSLRTENPIQYLKDTN